MIITNPRRNASVLTPFVFGFEEKLILFRSFIADSSASTDHFVRFLRTDSEDRTRFLKQFECVPLLSETMYIELYG